MGGKVGGAASSELRGEEAGEMGHKEGEQELAKGKLQVRK